MNLANFIAGDRAASGINICTGMEIKIATLMRNGQVQEPHVQQPGVKRVRGVMERVDAYRSNLTYPEKQKAVLVLAREGEVSIRKVADELDIELGGASDLLNRMVELKLLVRTRDGRHSKFKIAEAK